MGNWTIKESLQKMFPRFSNTSEKAQKLFIEYFEKLRKLSWEEYSKLLDSHHEKTNPIHCTDVDDSHCQCSDL